MQHLRRCNTCVIATHASAQNDSKSARERRQAARERLQKEEKVEEPEKTENSNDNDVTERVSAEVLETEKLENSIEF